jgi:hypothetical protein
MFKNRALSVQVVKTPNAEQAEGRVNNKQQLKVINNMIIEDVRLIATLAAIGYAGKKVLDTAGEIALIAAKAKIK